MSHPDPLYDPSEDFRCPDCEAPMRKCKCGYYDKHTVCDNCGEDVAKGQEIVHPQDKTTYCYSCAEGLHLV